MTKLATAYHRDFGDKPFTVPDHYINNPHVFGGVYSATPARTPKPSRPKRDSVETTPVAVEATPTTESDPATGAPTETKE